MKNTDGYIWTKIMFCMVTYYITMTNMGTCHIFPGRESRQASKREIEI